MAFYLVLWLLIAQGLLAQTNRSVSRIHGRIDSTAPIELHGHVPAAAQARFDRGAADPSLPLPGLALLFKPSPEQQAELDRFLMELQDPSSVNYHRWLTPEAYADRFGVSALDLKSIERWLSAEGFQVSYRARARNWIGFTGTAQQAERTFHTAIRHFLVDGEKHYANASEPFMPAALAEMVSAVRGLDDFRLQPMLQRRSAAGGARPEFNAGGNHFLVPDDLAAIYNLGPLYSAGINGTGQKIAIVGQTAIVLSDIAAFRSIFNLPVNVPQTVLYGVDPGIRSNDLQEAALDLEWAGAVARNATLVYVYATGVFNALQYAVDQAVAPVISMSYGACESVSGNLDTYRTVAQQAASQGISWVASSGDAGAAACDPNTAAQASRGKAVTFPASIPEVTAVGGTRFNENGGSYWSAANGPNQGSATGYIPEVAWNDTASAGVLASTGGGTSSHFSTPSWQTGAGFPNDGHRDVPDVALTASADHDGFLVCVLNTNCPSANWNVLGAGSGYSVFGGTSAGAPAFAGILALVNQYLMSQGAQTTAGLGSANPTLYWLAQNNPAVFHDVTAGNNIVPCRTGSTNCTTGSFGFSAGTGYDQATGLGSVDAFNLATAWAATVVPQISSIAPALPSSSASSQTITVSGSGFQAGLTVSITSPNKTIATQTGTSVTASSVQFTATFNSTGTWKVQVIDPDGRASNVFAFAVGAPGTSPTVVAGAATSITSSSAILNGSVNPNGGAAQAWFLYGTASNLASAMSSTPQSFGASNTSAAVTAGLSGLAPATIYYFQLVASNSGGTSKSSILTFTTPGNAMPAVTTGAVSGVSNTTATLSGIANPNGSSTLAWFRYGTNSTLSGSVATPQQDIGTGSSAVTVTAALTGLASGTTYYFQAMAANSAGTSPGAIVSFTTTTTLSAPPAATGLNPFSGASGVPSNPTLTWNAVPGATSYTVNFGLTNPPATVTSLAANSNSYSPGQMSGLTTYYWQVIATNAAGSTSSPVNAFTTGPLSMTGTRVGVFRGGSNFLEDSNGNGVYDPGADRFLSGFTGPGGFQTGDLAVAGDWNGDGHAKVGIYRSALGTWYLDANNDGVYDLGDYTYQFGGLANDVPMVGDWNAVPGVSAHKSCIGIYRPGGSVWLLDLNCDGSFEGTPADAFFPFGGLPGDVPVVGNWTGGTTRVGVVRKYAPAGIPQGEPFFWVLDNGDASAGNTPAAHPPAAGAFAFGGLPGDVFVTGDWNNGGAAKAGVFRSGAAGVQPFEWVLDANGRHSADLVFNLYGVAGDQAITGKW